jgi:hypothetical protein
VAKERRKKEGGKLQAIMAHPNSDDFLQCLGRGYKAPIERFFVAGHGFISWLEDLLHLGD